MKHDDITEDKKLIKKAFSMHDKQEHPGKKTDLSKLKKGGMTKMARGGGVEIKGKTKGKYVRPRHTNAPICCALGVSPICQNPFKRSILVINLARPTASMQSSIRGSGYESFFTTLFTLR